MCLLVFLLMMCTFYCQKLRCIRCCRTCRLRGVPCFWGQGKCVHVVLWWGECPEELNQCGRNRWCVRLAYGCLANFCDSFVHTWTVWFLKMSRCSRVRCRKIVYMFMCDSVCCSDDVYMFTVELITHAPSLVPNFFIQFSDHYVASGSCSHVTGFLIFAVSAAMYFCDFVAVAPAVAVIL